MSASIKLKLEYLDRLIVLSESIRLPQGLTKVSDKIFQVCDSVERDLKLCPELDGRHNNGITEGTLIATGPYLAVGQQLDHGASS